MEVARLLATAAANLENAAHTLTPADVPMAVTGESVTASPAPSVTPTAVTKTRAVQRAAAGGFAPTAEQEAIVEAAVSGGHLVIEAGAGTGKTSTLALISSALDTRRGLYLAFNRAIAAEARRKMPGTVTSSTAHSLAYRAVGSRYRRRLDSSRVPAAKAAAHLGITGDLAVGDVRLSPARQATMIMQMVGRFCHSDDRDVALHHLPVVHGITGQARTYLAGQLLPMAWRAWEDLQQTEGVLRFEHDHYLKMWALTDPDLGADYIMFDEAQDANPVLSGLIQRQRSAQQIVVGDSCQAIYGWRGAVDALATWPADTHLYLSRSFRFGAAIAAEANAWLSELNARLRLEGAETKTSRVGPLGGTADVVLCRTNAMALGRAMDVMAAGRRAALVGGGTAIGRLAEAARDLQAGKATSHPELFAFKTWGEVLTYVEEEREAAGELATLVRLIEDHGPDHVINATRRLSDEKSADVVCSTAHKAKGREWATVEIADDFREPKPDPMTGEPGAVPRADAMLAYVAVTRAMDHLDNGGLAWIHRRTRGEDVVRAADRAYGFEGI
ncbi:UvrD-helicase domain-containing protein [Marinactinospora thermotolerans]|uniref:UvrD-helicase domain-containing protein n=1 Tax=Marinactinospora thermotolerans TaxID=531310 RepID=UPI003D9291B1